jgi:hypothetical protein
MGWLQKIRGAVTGGSGDDEEWIAVDGVGDTAALLRTIAELLPRDGTVNIVKPRSAEVEGLLQQHKTGASNPEEGDYYLPMSGNAVAQLAALVSEIHPEPAFGAVLVAQNGRNLLEAYRRDSSEDVVWLSATMPGETLGRMRQTLDRIAQQCAAAAAAARPAQQVRSA